VFVIFRSGRTGSFDSPLARPAQRDGFTNSNMRMGEKWLQTLRHRPRRDQETAIIANPKKSNTALYLRAIEPAAEATRAAS